jgi:hypothetical protein
MAPSGESSCRLRDELVPPLQLVISSSFLFFLLKSAKPSLSRMRLFGYIVVFTDDVRDDEITIWHCAHWGRGGLTVAACHCYGSTRERGGPNPIGPHCHGPTKGRGCSSPTADPPIAVLLEEEVLQGPTVSVPLEEEEVPIP